MILVIPDKYTPANLSNVHDGRYSYERYEYRGAERPATFICPEHGEFTQIPYSHAKGHGCMMCAARDRAARSTAEEFEKRAKQAHGDIYDYSRVSYTNAREKVEIVCPEHGAFYQTPDAHLRGQGCPSCGNIKKGLSKRATTETFIEKARSTLDVEYNYSMVDYITAVDKVSIVCPNGHVFKQQPNNHLSGYGCPVCQISPLHKHLLDNLGGEANKKDLLDNGQELDLWFSDEKVAFEINGVYWHSSLHKPRMYHQEKTEAAARAGIKLYHVWYDSLTDFDLVLSWAKNKLGRETNRVYARKTTVSDVSTEDYREFLSHNHLQGSVDARIRLGLFDSSSRLVAVMGMKKSQSGWYLSRFAVLRHTLVVGGFSKLLSYFVKHYSPEKIVSYSDMAYSDGGLYRSNGFSEKSVSTSPRLYYTNGRVLADRWQFQRKNVKKRNPEMEYSSEKEMAAAEGFYQVFGCKTVRWELSI
ncbi:MAG: hypothetical protein WC965_01935 [Thiohalomonadaceae bacterium]